MGLLSLETQIVYTTSKQGSGFVCRFNLFREFNDLQDPKLTKLGVHRTHHLLHLSEDNEVSLLVLWRYNFPTEDVVILWQPVLQRAAEAFVQAGKEQKPPNVRMAQIGSMGDIAVRTGLDPREDSGEQISQRLKSLGAMNYQPILQS